LASTAALSCPIGGERFASKPENSDPQTLKRDGLNTLAARPKSMPFPESLF
jgi:hypothetical protein